MSAQTIPIPGVVRVDSIDSFEEVNVNVMKATDDQPSGNLKVNGKVPPVLYVLKYVGWDNGVIECRQSLTPFKRIPLFKETKDARDLQVAQIGEYGDEDDEKPVFDIVYSISKNGADGESRSRGGEACDRPITDAFDLNDYRHEEYDTYGTENESKTTPDLKPSMNIHSKYLIHALQAVVEYYPRVTLQGDPVTIAAPYRVLYLHRKELAHYRDHQPKCHDEKYAATTAEHIDVLLNFLAENLGDVLKDEETLHELAQPAATFDLFWLLLKPGNIIYAKRYNLWTPFVISSVRPGSSIKNEPCKVDCWFMESNGVVVKRFMESFTLQPWSGEQVISSLPLVPEEFWVENLAAQGGKTMREKCIEEGKTYWELLKKPAYMQYDGNLVNPSWGNRQEFGITGHLRGRVICDPVGFDRFYLSSPDCVSVQRNTLNSSRRANHSVPPLDHLPLTLPHCGCAVCKKEQQRSSAASETDSLYAGFEDLDAINDAPPASNRFYHILSNTIPGFVLNTRRWASLNVGHLHPVQPSRDAFKDLVLQDEVKMTVKALIGKLSTAEDEQRSLQPWNTDLVQNKGEGRIFLLHGTPGVGKTCTVECIADASNRPLIAITSGDLGTDNYRVETNLQYFLDLGQRYGALLLLDEADVYLERRRSKDIARNGLVSVFLRALEYYRGVLFLTTNRVQAFDSAFMSRIHVALHYKNLRDEDREKIWAGVFERLERESHDTVRVSAAARALLLSKRRSDVATRPPSRNDLPQDLLRSLKWNGREIRNAMQTMLALAEAQSREEGSNVVVVEEKHVMAVVRMSGKFKTYLRRTTPVSLEEVEVEGDTDTDSDEEA